MPKHEPCGCKCWSDSCDLSKHCAYHQRMLALARASFDALRRGE